MSNPEIRTQMFEWNTVRRVTKLLTLLVVLSCAMVTAPAQESATLAGTVTDPSGALVGGARVSIQNQDTQTTRVVTSDAGGEYVAPSLAAGNYVVTVDAAGFKELKRTEVRVTGATTVTVDLQLAVGGQNEVVSVTSTPPLLQTLTAEVSALVDSRQMVALPLATRDFTDLVLLTPGAHIGSATNLAELGSPYAMRGGANYSVNGSIAGGNSYLIDGLYDRNQWLNTLVMVPVVDSILEYRVLTSNYSAEYGEAAGAVTAVETKSGTDTLHGNIWEFLRNDKLNANNYFNKRSGIARPGFHRNEFGGTLGGPILHHKTFFFADYQGIRASQPVTTTSTIPTTAQDQMIITGNFANFGQQLYNPYSTTGSGSTLARNPFVGNNLAGFLDPVAVNFAKLLPTPTNSAATNNFTYNGTSTLTTDQFDIRIDQNVGGADRLFAKYSYDNSKQTVTGVIPTPASAISAIGPYLSTATNGTSAPLLNQSATLGYTRVVSSHTVVSSHAGLLRWRINITPLDAPYSGASSLGMPGININARSGGLPAFTVSGFQEFGDNSSYPEESAITTLQLDSAATMIRGTHTIKYGGLFLRHWFNGFSAFPTRGTFDFNGEYTRQVGSTTSSTSLADFAIGATDNASRNILTGTFGMRFWQVAPFVQDTWRVNDRLTLNYGLRWEVDAPPYEAHNRWANLDIKTGLLLVAGINGNGRRLRSFDLNTFAPRAGVTYLLTKDRKTVLRAGYGTSYVTTDAAGAQLYKNLPYYFAQTVTTSINTAPIQTLSQSLPAPVQPDVNNQAALSVGSPNVWDMHLRQSDIMQWSLGVQRDLFGGMLLDVSYVGTRGQRLLVNSLNLNQAVPGPGPVATRRPYYAINPNLVNVAYRTGAGDSRYNSLQVHAEKRYSRGLTFGVSYTYSEFLADVGNPNGSGNSDIQNDACLKCNYGPTPDSYRHVLSVNHVYDLPFGPDGKYLKEGVLGHIVGGWSINGIWTVYSGGHFTPILGTNVSNSAGGGDQRPNRIANGNLPSSQRTVNAWYDPTAFVAPPQYSFGNAGTGILTGPGYFDTDLGLLRDFPFREHYGVTFRAEFFNAFNRANFNNPGATIGTSSAGVINSTLPARVGQLALKLRF